MSWLRQLTLTGVAELTFMLFLGVAVWLQLEERDDTKIIRATVLAHSHEWEKPVELDWYHCFESGPHEGQRIHVTAKGSTQAEFETNRDYLLGQHPPNCPQ